MPLVISRAEDTPESEIQQACGHPPVRARANARVRISRVQ